MALYVHLVKITPQGASKIREGSSSYETVRKFGESLGCKPLNVVACFGQYDYVGIWDCPNEVAALKLAGCAVSTGDVQVQTLPACKVEDFFKVMSELPRERTKTARPPPRHIDTDYAGLGNGEDAPGEENGESIEKHDIASRLLSWAPPKTWSRLNDGLPFSSSATISPSIPCRWVGRRCPWPLLQNDG